ncbi:MAG: glutamate synthase subunit beta [Eubacteriales bacterium]
MGKATGFMEYDRVAAKDVAPEKRLKNWDEFHVNLPEEIQKEQGARCMDCGIPFCHTGIMIAGMVSGCPLNNLIPEFNDMVYRGLYNEAYERLLQTNPFAEFTGRVCPAPCEGACTAGLNGDPVTIKCNERAIIDKAFENGLVKPLTPVKKTGKKTAVVGAGPAGLSTAYYLCRAGHDVTVFERADRAGGLMMYGIPNMKLDKQLVLRRIKLLEDSGVSFVYNTEIGVDKKLADLKKEFDAVVLCGGATAPRDLRANNREGAKGIYFAVDFLKAATERLLGGKAEGKDDMDAKGKDVVIIGGGDTGTDCVGTSIRQGCKSVTQLEIMPMPAKTRQPNNPWPQYPKVLKTDYGQEEAIHVYGKDPRDYEMMTTDVVTDKDGNVTALKAVKVKWTPDENGRFSPVPIKGSETTYKADIVLLAMGFLGPEKTMIDEMNLSTDPRGNILGDDKHYATSSEGVFVAGDMRRGQSLVVWALKEGCEAAKACDKWLSED